jgi:hypothetical protein
MSTCGAAPPEGGFLGVLIYKYVYAESEEKDLVYKCVAATRKYMKDHTTAEHGGTKKAK